MNVTSNRIVKAIGIGGILFTLALTGCGASNTASDPTSDDAADNISQKVQTTRGPLSATVVVNPEEPRLSDLLTVTLTVAAKPNIEIKLPEFRSAFPDLLVRDFQDPLPEISADQKMLVQIYKLEPMVAGELVIPSFTIRYRDEQTSSTEDDEPENEESEAWPGELVTDELTFTVATMVNTDNLSLDAIKPLAAPIALPEPVTPFPLLQWLVGIVSVVVAIVVGWIWLKKRDVEDRLSASEIAASELNNLVANQAAREDVSTFYVQLTAIVRRYIEAVTGVKAAEQTTEEFLREMQDRRLFSSTSKQRLQEFLEASDLIKFAGQTPDSESIEDSIQAARQFIQLPPDDEQIDSTLQSV